MPNFGRFELDNYVVPIMGGGGVLFYGGIRSFASEHLSEKEKQIPQLLVYKTCLILYQKLLGMFNNVPKAAKRNTVWYIMINFIYLIDRLEFVYFLDEKILAHQRLVPYQNAAERCFSPQEKVEDCRFKKS